jgi:hypothetical protein
MRTDEERLRFLERFRLSTTWNNEGVSIYWRGQDRPGHPGGFVPVSKGRTLAEATDLAIARWEKKHKKRFV